MDFFAQATGIAGMLANTLAFQFKNKKTIILCQLMGSILFAVNMFMLNAIMGGLLNVVGIARALVYMNKEQIKIPVKAINGGFMFLYCLSYVLIFTLFGKEATPLNLIIEVLPLIGMGAMTIGLSMNRARAIRVCGFINSPSWLVYNCVNFSIGGIIGEVLGLISSISAYIRLDVKKKEEAPQ